MNSSTDTFSSSEMRTLNGIVTICTRNRPADLMRALIALSKDDPTVPVLVVDASDGDDSADVCNRQSRELGLNIRYVRAPEVGLARQRNFSIELVAGHDVVHYIDDDTTVLPGYLRGIESVFESDPTVVGVGAVVVDQPPVRSIAIKSIFGLYSSKPGRVLRSGHVTLGHYPDDTEELRHVQWLPGCCMSYRVGAIGEVRFDRRLAGYSWGEDFDFSYRLADGRDVLRITPRARCLHAVSQVNRQRLQDMVRARVGIQYRWVKENKIRGFSPALFWWSVAGELLLRGTSGLRDRQSRGVAAGVALGVADVVRARIRRTYRVGSLLGGDQDPRGR